MDYNEFNDKLAEMVSTEIAGERIRMGKGSLVIQVSTANGALPVKEAKVTVMDINKTVITTEYTDISGRTEVKNLDTVSAVYSQEPSGRTVSYSYNILVEKENYYTEEFINVPIFDNIRSIQPVFLIPIDKNGTENDFIYVNESENGGVSNGSNI